jgi:PAS domain-containing protein
MKKQELHCLIIRGHAGYYSALVQTLKKFSDNIKIELIDNDALRVKQALQDKKFGLIFLFQESGLSAEAIADIMRNNGSESILVSLNDIKPQSVLSVKSGSNRVQVCNLHFTPSGSTSALALKFLLQYAFLKTEFRNCKSLLRVSEQRCHWLVDSSSEAVAYISNDLHLYANQTYINLLACTSLHRLKMTSVSDVILEDEKAIFFDFIRQNKNQIAKKSTLIVTLHPQQGADFRASIRLIPTVFSGTRCYQLWIRKLGSGRLPPVLNETQSSYDDSSLYLGADIKTPSPWQNSPAFQAAKEDVEAGIPKIEHPIITKESNQIMKKKRSKHAARFSEVTRSVSTRKDLKTKDVNKKPPIYTTLLRQVLLSADVSLTLSKLDMLGNTNITTRQYMVDLNVEEQEYNNVSHLLPKKYHDIFWDQTMILLLFKRLKQAGSKGMRLLIPLTEAAVNDDGFKLWFSKSISRFEKDISRCILLLPLVSNTTKGENDLKEIKQYLDKQTCQIGIDNFELNQHTKTIINITRPKFVRFSKKWVLSHIKSKKQAVKFANTIKILEKNNIKVIAPYNSGNKMRQLFDLSGASFCQKQAVS